MIEFTTTEFALICWAVVATAYAMKWRDEKRKGDYFIHAIFDDVELRNHLVDDYNRFKGKVESQ